MDVTGLNEPLLILLIGLLVIVAILLQSRLKAIGLPSLIGFIFLGFAIRLADTRLGFLSENALGVFDVLGKIGVICLLFRIGLDSDLVGLVSQMRRAALVWFACISVTGVAGFLVTYRLLGLSILPSVFVTAALTATSVGVAVELWRESGSLHSEAGNLLIDAAEMNDISGVVILALLFAVAPILRRGPLRAALPSLGRTLLTVGIKLVGFSALCVLFSRFVEKPYTRFFSRIESSPGFMITLAGTAFVLAATAGLLGFSVAIGAFFAGLVFSRDPRAVRVEGSFDALYNLFVPFFFIGIGLSLDPGAMVSSLSVGAVLTVTAVAAMFLAAWGSSVFLTDWRGAVLIGLSKVPRAEIAMIIVQKGRALGDWAVPPQLFGGMVLVSLVTCTVIPMVLKKLLALWPQGQGDGGG
jgi:Kef-type K+ transport system membrane component KefB